MTEYLTVKNWEKFQHYKDRNPPWIKLHYEIMTSSDWVMLADASKLLAVVCMMIASRNNGQIPANPEYIKRVAYLDKAPNLTPLIECGFLINPLADASTMQADARPETYRTETDTERKKERVMPVRKSERGLSLHFLGFWKRYPATGGSRKKTHERWQKINGDEHAEEIMRGLEGYLQNHRILTEAKKFAPEHPYPQKWLGEQRWKEFLKTEEGASPRGEQVSMEALIASDKTLNLYTSHLKNGGMLEDSALAYLQQKLGDNWKNYV